MSLANDLRNALSEYLGGTVRAEEFGRRFAELKSDAHRLEDAEALELCQAVEWELLDRKRDLSTDSELRERLQVMSETPAIVLGVTGTLAALVVAQGLDTASAWHGVEANPLMGARFGWRGVALVVEYYWRRPKLWATLNIVAAGTLTAIAVRNLRVK